MPFQVRPDVARNRLYVTLQGLISDEEARDACEAVIRELPRLRPGFYVINDLTTFRPVTQSGVGEIKRAGVACAQAGMKATVRVSGISATVITQFNRASKEGGYTAFNATSMAEAEALLDGHRDDPEKP